MGYLLNGTWQVETGYGKPKDGHFVRSESQFRHTITETGDFKPEAGRYHLYVSYACPWAHRTLIMRQLKQLSDIISYSTVDARAGEHGWTFGQSGPDTKDPLYNKSYLHEIYTQAQPDYSGRVTVPILWDKQRQTIVNNESAEIIRQLNHAFDATAPASPDYYPAALAQEIDELNSWIYDSVNNSVYRCGFATTQVAYEAAFDTLFNALGELEQRLSSKTYLCGDQITEADWRLFTTLIRFDAVYVGHFKCNLRRIADYPQLSRYLKDLYHQPGVQETVRMDHIKDHYYQSHTHLNPSGIVPKGPLLDL